jgi:glucokinase
MVAVSGHDSPGGDMTRSRPPVPTPEADAAGLHIGVDVGGTKIAAGVVDGSGKILTSTHRPSPAGDAVRTLDAILDAVRELRETHDVLALGVAAAGFVDAERAVVMFAPNLAWRDEPLRDEIEQRAQLPVVVENDANAVAWAEARFGAGRGERQLVALTVGTGIGGGFVIEGAVQRGRFIVMVPGGRPCPCGLQGCLEQYASGNAILRRAQEVATTSPVLAEDLLARAGGRTDHIEGWMITEAARAGDVVALQVFDEVGAWLGRGIAQLAAVLDPGIVVLGGGVSAAGDLLLERVRDAFAKNLTGRGHRPSLRIEMAEFGPEAGMIGVADLARDVAVV